MDAFVQSNRKNPILFPGNRWCISKMVKPVYVLEEERHNPHIAKNPVPECEIIGQSWSNANILMRAKR